MEVLITHYQQKINKIDFAIKSLDMDNSKHGEIQLSIYVAQKKCYNEIIKDLQQFTSISLTPSVK